MSKIKISFTYSFHYQYYIVFFWENITIVSATRGDGVQFQRAKMEPSTGRNPVEKKSKKPKNSMPVLDNNGEGSRWNDIFWYNCDSCVLKLLHNFCNSVVGLGLCWIGVLFEIFLLFRRFRGYSVSFLASLPVLYCRHFRRTCRFQKF